VNPGETTDDGKAGAVTRSLSPDDRVVVSGAAGFIGSAVVRALLQRQAHVVALVEPEGDDRNLAQLDVERVPLDVRDRQAVSDACKGARFIFHLAAMYRFWAPRPRDFYEVNVGGSLNFLEAARRSGCEQMVYTSTVGVVGLQGAAAGIAADEECYADVAHLFGLYKRTKYVAEHEVLRGAAQGIPVSLVLPTFPVGPRDRRPTPTGRLILDFLNGRIPAFVDTTLNVVHVDDLAVGHLLALESGAQGRSYIVGGENLGMGTMLGLLAGCTGLRAPTLQVPRAVALSVGFVSQFVEGKLLGREPSVALEAARMSTTNMKFDDSRARTELGYRSRPAEAALADAAEWFLSNGYVKPARASRFQMAPAAMAPE
jgi:dihydroflavonol-4-reductase